jgi:hypothetical protein
VGAVTAGIRAAPPPSATISAAHIGVAKATATAIKARTFIFSSSG